MTADAKSSPPTVVATVPDGFPGDHRRPRMQGRVVFVTGGTRGVHFLASDHSSFITGAVWDVNGGQEM